MHNYINKMKLLKLSGLKTTVYNYVDIFILCFTHDYQFQTLSYLKMYTNYKIDLS